MAFLVYWGKIKIKIQIRHRWTGRYEAHLWDKSTWNQNQNKKGKQGANCLLWILSLSFFPPLCFCFLDPPALGLFSIMVPRFIRWIFTVIKGFRESDTMYLLFPSCAWKLTGAWSTLASLFGWVQKMFFSLAAIDFIGLFTWKSNYPCRCIWWWGSSSQSIWSCCLEILGAWDSHQFSSETSLTSFGRKKKFISSAHIFAFLFLLPLRELVSYSQKTLFRAFVVRLWVAST